MSMLEFETTIASSLQKVWDFYEDPAKSLPLISPPTDQVKVESIDLPLRVGSRLVIFSGSPIGRIKWIARIVEHRPPHAVVFGEEARFVDEQESGPFKSWRHDHDFERIDEKSTRI